jgi:VIT1/CCC1 family predicted Fe2+/Mn2+ transporter
VRAAVAECFRLPARRTQNVSISKEVHKKLIAFQRNEITEYHIYRKIARTVTSPENRDILERIAADEKRHYEEWREYTNVEVGPSRFLVWTYYLLSRVLGFTFGVRLMERGEEAAQRGYEEIKSVVPDAERILREEDEHELELLRFLDEERLRYTGSIVLGLNDALVELTGALAGFTFALQDTKLIALTGSITGIAAALSMGSSEYLSTKTEKLDRSPGRAAIYTGGAYIMAVVVLILPYLVFDNLYFCLACALAASVVIIALFNYYISVAKDEPFKSRFLEMAGLSLGVAAITFAIGLVLRRFLGVEV